MKAFVIAMFLFSFNVYTQNCTELNTGIFELKTEIGNLLIERFNEYQLESNNDLGLIYLNKIERINDCEYNLTRYKIIKNDVFPMPNMNDKLHVQVYKVDDKNFYITSTLIGTSMSMEGQLTKINGEISETFKNILQNENQ